MNGAKEERSGRDLCYDHYIILMYTSSMSLAVWRA